MDVIPFNRPYTTAHATSAMTDAAERGHLSGDGHYTKLANSLLRALTGSHRVLLTTSCTHALEMSAMLLGVGPGDEVIMPSFTFVSTANAFALRGATPVFVDIRPDTFNIDERLIEAAITERTRAIVVVHYAGVGCEMDEITDIAARHGLQVVEDNAHGFGGTYRGRNLGTIAPLATLSFHETKNIQCGEGGALLVNDESLFEDAEILREKGTNRSRFFRGQVDKYTWVSLGSSYLPSDLLAAYLVTQLEEFDEIQKRRMLVWQRYRSDLSSWAASAGFSLQHCPDDRNHPAHLFALIAPDLASRQALIAHLGDHAIKAVFHYVPLHSSPVGRTFGERHLPVTDDISDRLVRLPLFPTLDERQLDRIVSAVTSFG
ncbi:MAG: dTDP-4-amino-4,6-dideoxygalactose transaminase [Actinobacteria bacterium]|nr:dTDP-4-amino-4,6-dideoxygalactose transaminase [Actinomycetota bacterium]